MSYGADFANADPANAPLNGPLFIGADPLVWGAILLGLAGALLLGWLIGQRGGASRADAAETIWKAIDAACQAAMSVNSDALPASAKALRKEIADRLGSVLALADGIGKPLKDLDAAIKGKFKEPALSAAAAHAGPVTLAVLHNSQLVVKSEGTDGKNEHASPEPPKPPEPKERDMTTEEQADALRRGVSRFNDYWCHKEPRIDDLRVARQKLCYTAPIKSTLQSSDKARTFWTFK